MNPRRAFAVVRGQVGAGGRHALAAVRWLAVRKDGLFLTLRWLAGAALAVWTVRQAVLVGYEESNLVFAALHSLYALAGLLASVLLVSPELAGWTLTPLNRLIDAVLLPSDSEPPPVDYTLARVYREQMRYEESCDEYLKIIRYHPRELRAYLEGMQTAGEARQTKLAAKFYRLGQRAFRREETRRKLQKGFEESCLYALLADEAATEETVEPPGESEDTT